VKSLRNYSIEIYGVTRSGERGWKEYVGIYPNIKVHPGEISIDEALDLMKRSKIVLNSVPSFQNGSHERVLNGFLTGCMPVTNDNSFWREYFEEGELIFYKHGEWEKINESVATYLNDKQLRHSSVINGQKVVLENHTWDQRADRFIQFFNSEYF